MRARASILRPLALQGETDRGQAAHRERDIADLPHLAIPHHPPRGHRGAGHGGRTDGL